MKIWVANWDSGGLAAYVSKEEFMKHVDADVFEYDYEETDTYFSSDDYVWAYEVELNGA